jgi:hypothetical protein
MGFRSSLDGSGLDAMGTDRQHQSGNRSQDDRMAAAEPGARAEAQLFLECVEHLQRGLETRLPRQQLRQTRRLRHDRSHQV